MTYPENVSKTPYNYIRNILSKYIKESQWASQCLAKYFCNEYSANSSVKSLTVYHMNLSKTYTKTFT